MDFQSAENQAQQLQQQATQVTQRLKDLADKLQTRIDDQNLAREATLDLRETALALQQQNQVAMNMIQQMGQYIQQLESQLASPTQGAFQPRGWSQGAPPSGGFLSNVASGLGLGAGFGVGEELVDSIFDRW